MNLSEIRLPFIHTLAFTRGTTSASTARHENAETIVLFDAADRTPSALIEQLQTRLTGLTEEEVRDRRAAHGRNAVAHERSTPWPMLLLNNLRNPFIGVLVLLGAVSYATDDLKGTAVVSVMVIVSVVMRFLQEYRSSKAADTLRSMVLTTATVSRDGQRREVPFEDLVPGDIVHLSAGDMVPADVRLLSAKDVFVSQSALTGESLPVEKLEQEPSGSPAVANALGRANLCFMGTNLVSGTATALVILTGACTQFGSLAKSVVNQRALTSFDKGVNRVTWVLIRFMLVMVPVVFLLNGFVKGDFKQAFLFAIAVAVGLTPEMLPMVVTANLARGAVAMSRHKVIVKRLNAIQNLGAMDVLCTDKTGTLTQDKVVLEKHLNLTGRSDLRVLELAYLNSYYQTGLKNLLDRAVLEHVELAHAFDVLQHHTKVDEIPFDFTRRRMSVVVANGDARHVLICKGAVEEMLTVCSGAELGGDVVKLSSARQQDALALVRGLNEEGFRVVAVASKTLPTQDATYSVSDERGLVLAGFMAFLDPPKASASEAIAALQNHGVRVIVLTGDNDVVTHRVCRDVGLPIDRVVLGHEVDDASDAELADLSESTAVFAKLTPAQKARIVRALKGRGHTVGYLGDGINDAPALRDADVGISVDTATDIARESADIILLEKSLLVLEDGVLRGREVYGNIVKYIKMTASSNFGNVFSVLIASAVLPFLPMLPVQLLIQNLLYDFSQLSLPWDRMDPEFLTKPRKWDASGIARFMAYIGPISSVFDVTTFAVLWFVMGASSVERQGVFQSGWFIEGLLSQTLIVHMIRTKKVPFIQSTAALPVLLLTAVVMAVGIYFPFSRLGSATAMARLPWTYFPWLAVTLLAYCALTQGVKTWYIRRFHAWL
jgi:Mg2+-importing ATPase